MADGTSPIGTRGNYASKAEFVYPLPVPVLPESGSYIYVGSENFSNGMMRLPCRGRTFSRMRGASGFDIA
jgi:hypothetical protein